MYESTIKFQELVESIDRYNDVSVSESVRHDFKKKVSEARKIYVTGTGTSLPCALLMEELINNNNDYTALFLPTAKMIHKIPSLKKDDLVILISQGMNRSDSLIIYENIKSRCKSVVISGNRSFLPSSDTLAITVEPEKEKIFCRPVSPITTFRAVCQLFYIDLPMPVPSTESLIEIADWVDTSKQLIILYSADISFAAQLWGIILREGAGINTSIKDLENYSHGYYGVDTKDLNNRQYLILTCDTKADEKDFDRAKNLYEIPDFNKHVYKVSTGGDSLAANLLLFREGPQLISEILIRTDYDMNHPNGMTENRRYHEYDHYKDYIQA